MSDSNPKLPPVPQLTQEQLDAIAGAGCSVNELADFIEGLKESYENAISATVYIMERVTGNPAP